MVFSKSFGYALRSILYVGMANKQQGRIQLDEIADALGLPRYFLGKIMRRLAQQGILDSDKGHKGGFSFNKNTLGTTLAELVEATGETEDADTCALRLKKCNALHPCPLHHDILVIRQRWNGLLEAKTIGHLLQKEDPDFLRSIAL
ncbi:MAG: Rrf2 family transcriptional regulator [Candidatus Pseudobacter hemicellulosilyticus]|uniref:Rrf2 family transcriptional regulator n=1 Tax=Candidatus Pseudobacter hemicellulosilyticus TaxID=3121375 RepID=A0AAJ5WL55_9BACT|nr:MAG: Rrf2 family transcriptional regulator [Pseudobacter sp.]